jgi:hypothetical protein
MILHSSSDRSRFHVGKERIVPRGTASGRGQEYMNRAATLPLLSLRGTSGEMGIEYGKAVSSLIELNLEDYLQRFRDVVGLSDAEVLRWGETFRKVTRDYKASIGEMLEGIAEGSGSKPEHIFALNARCQAASSPQPKLPVAAGR